MTVLDVTLILGVKLCDSYRPVPELPGKSTFFGSSDEFIEKRRQGLQHFLEKWVDVEASTCLLRRDREGGRCQSGWPIEHTGAFGVDTFFFTLMLTQARALQWMGLGRANPQGDAVLTYLCLPQGPAECCPPVRQPVTPLLAKPALSAWDRSLCPGPKPHDCFWCHSSLCYVQLWLGSGREAGFLSLG